MLRFIQKLLNNFEYSIFHFNTSHVTVYLPKKKQRQLMYQDFNTSHVTVYPAYLSVKSVTFSYFNTSHVTVYHFFGAIARRHAVISIHLMLRFILYVSASPDTQHSISIHLMLRFILEKGKCSSIRMNFNTSHVTVYLGVVLLIMGLLLYFNTSHVTVYH